MIRARTAVILASFGTFAAMGFAAALVMIGVGQLCEGIACARWSERNG